MSTHPKALLSLLLALAFTAAAAALYFSVSSIRNLFQNKQAPAKALSTVAVSPAELALTGARLKRPIYWIGPSAASTTYELSQNSNNQVFVRYLPAGVKVGSTKSFLAIATYPMKNAFALTSALARKAGSVRVAAPRPAVALHLRQHPENIYLAYPGASYQIEVFDPSATLGRDIVRSGLLVDVSAKTANSARAVTAAALASSSRVLGQPIYWLGPKANTTYELTRTTNGRVYVRYLPTGAGVGTRTPYLTVGTYPLANAYAVTRKLAATSAKVQTAPNTVAFSRAQKPTSLYVAFAGVNFQVEVFDPTATAGHPITAVSEVTNAS